MFLLVCIFLNSLPSFADEPDPNYELGATYYEKQMYTEAVERFKKVITKNHQNADAYYYLGLSLYALAYYNEALDAFLAANNLYSPPLIDVNYRMALTYMELGKIDEALNEFHKVSGQDIDKELAANAQNWIETIEGEQIKEISNQAQAENLNFKNGIDLYETQKYEESEIAFNKTLQDNLNQNIKGLTYYYLGVIHYNQNKYPQSVSDFKQVITLKPDTQISRDATSYITAINDFIGPYNKLFTLTVFVGPRFDTNINYVYGKDAIPDLSTVLTAIGSYRPNDFLEAKLTYFFNWNTSLISNSLDKPNISADYNFQTLQSLITYSQPLSHLLQLESEGQFNWWNLGGRNYLFNGKISPKLSVFATPRLITTLQGNFEINSYPDNNERNSVGAGAGITQYIYLWNRQSWVKLGYEYESVLANDDLKKFISESDTLINYRYANSYTGQNFFLTIGFPLILNSRLQLISKLSLLNYTNPDIFQQYEKEYNPVEDQSTMELKQDLKKYRADSLLSLGVEYFLPITPIWTFSAYYNYTRNISNISRFDYSVDRSYDKDLIGINLIANF